RRETFWQRVSHASGVGEVIGRGRANLQQCVRSADLSSQLSHQTGGQHRWHDWKRWTFFLIRTSACGDNFNLFRYVNHRKNSIKAGVEGTNSFFQWRMSGHEVEPRFSQRIAEK